MARQSFHGHPELSLFFSKLWDLDDNRIMPGDNYQLNLQGSTHFSTTPVDHADKPLFSCLDENYVFSKETYKRFVALLDNYSKEIGVPEVITPQERKENEDFLDSILKTKVMQEAHRFLVSEGKSSDSLADFKIQLYDIWFKLYKRNHYSKAPDSSAFEHVFVGETRSKEVIGFHNWIQFYLQEKKKFIDYKGHMINGSPKDKIPRLYTIQFSWKNSEKTKDRESVKAKGSTFIGTSPEFEIALYTVCFLVSEETKIPLQIQDYEVEIVCHRNKNGTMGSAYPVAK